MTNVIVNKILITLAFIFLYRMLAYIPIPGVDVNVIKSFFDNNSTNFLGLFNMFSGKAVERFSIISLGIMPYITASIVMELFAATSSKLARMKKERDGMHKYMQIIRYVTIAITIIQSISVSIGLQSFGSSYGNPILIDVSTFVFISVFAMLSGTMMLMWIGEQITQRGIGNGISLIIFAGIVSSIPTSIYDTFSLINRGEINFLIAIAMLIIIIFTILIIIFVELSERRIPVSYARKIVMQNQNKRIMNYIPIKLNLSGVIPPIFASAILIFPSTLLQTSSNQFMLSIADIINPNGYIYSILMFLFVIFFSFFYSSIVFNAKDISDNLKRQGGFIPGLRPGESTSSFLNSTASQLTFWGSLYLACITTIPWVLLKSMGIPFIFGGTAVLIVVQVAVDTMRRIESQIYMNKYQTLGNVGL